MCFMMIFLYYVNNVYSSILDSKDGRNYQTVQNEALEIWQKSYRYAGVIDSIVPIEWQKPHGV